MQLQGTGGRGGRDVLDAQRSGCLRCAARRGERHRHVRDSKVVRRCTFCLLLALNCLVFCLRYLPSPVCSLSPVLSSTYIQLYI